MRIDQNGTENYCISKTILKSVKTLIKPRNKEQKFIFGCFNWKNVFWYNIFFSGFPHLLPDPPYLYIHQTPHIRSLFLFKKQICTRWWWLIPLIPALLIFTHNTFMTFCTILNIFIKVALSSCFKILLWDPETVDSNKLYICHKFSSQNDHTFLFLLYTSLNKLHLFMFLPLLK